ncbi:SPFH domain-containing protein [Synechococcus sp. ATX 2A4]|uniref:SPFH domain-containing protein n=1 Tax=Synechococcus sp. ATX 2A4 TaxID=2823727 RepID=UPI0020CC02C6|nr:SPFH domain-containing protein [Synechococcus sp. ATX 2A4]
MVQAGAEGAPQAPATALESGRSTDPLLWALDHAQAPLRVGTWLKVEADQVAVFAVGDRLADVLPTGRHQLKRQTLPKLAGVIDLPGQEGTFFNAQIHVVDLRSFIALPWGLRSAQPVLPPALWQEASLAESFSASGRCAIQCRDPLLLLRTLGARQLIEGPSRPAPAVAELLAPLFLEICSQLRQVSCDGAHGPAREEPSLAVLANSTEDRCRGSFAAVGLALSDVSIESLTLPAQRPAGELPAALEALASLFRPAPPPPPPPPPA